MSGLRRHFSVKTFCKWRAGAGAACSSRVKGQAEQLRVCMRVADREVPRGKNQTIENHFPPFWDPTLAFFQKNPTFEDRTTHERANARNLKWLNGSK